MNSYFKNNIITVILTNTILVFPQIVDAQKLNGVFIMSSVAGLKNMANISMPVTFNSNSSCINIQNGAALLNRYTGIGTFNINCEVDIKFNTLGIKLYPNPVIGITTLKSMISPPFNNPFKISIWGIHGYKITSGKATGHELFQGMVLDFSMLQVGTYIIQIESEKLYDAFKFIKVNNEYLK
jgi:hypothetical protein